MCKWVRTAYSPRGNKWRLIHKREINVSPTHTHTVGAPPSSIHASMKKNKEIKSKMSKLNSCPKGFQAQKYTNTKSRLNTKPIAMS